MASQISIKHVLRCDPSDNPFLKSTLMRNQIVIHFDFNQIMVDSQHWLFLNRQFICKIKGNILWKLMNNFIRCTFIDNSRSHDINCGKN